MRANPRSHVLLGVRVVAAGVQNEEADAASPVGVQEADVLSNLNPALAGLAVVDAPELERAETV